MAYTTIDRFVPREIGRNKRILASGKGVVSIPSSRVGGAETSWLENFFEIDENDNLKVLTDFSGVGDLTAFAGANPPVPNWWDSLPIATTSTLGGIIVGANLTIDANGVLNGQSGGTGSGVWGAIAGTISDQTDLWTELGLKYSSSNTNIGTGATNYSAGNHLHTGVYEPVFAKGTGFNKNFGTASGTVAQGNDSRINNGQTAFGWGDHALAGYASGSHTHAYLNNFVSINKATAATEALDVNGRGKFTGDSRSAIFHRVGVGNPGLAFSNDNGIVAQMFCGGLSGGTGGFRIRPNTTDTTKDVFISTSGKVSINRNGEGAEMLNVGGNAVVSGQFKLSSQWSIGYSGTDLIFYNSASNSRAKLDQAGNLICEGDVTAFGTI